MCDVLDRVEARGVAIGEKRGEARGVAIGEKRGEARGVAIGEKKGESRLAALMDQLLSQGRLEDARRAAKDENFRACLFKEFQIY